VQSIPDEVEKISSSPHRPHSQYPSLFLEAEPRVVSRVILVPNPTQVTQDLKPLQKLKNLRAPQEASQRKQNLGKNECLREAAYQCGQPKTVERKIGEERFRAVE